MASQSRKTGFPDSFANLQSAEAVRGQFFDAPLAVAQQSVLGSAAAIATLLGILPDAFAASQRRELDRILKSGGDWDPRVAALQASIEQADILRATAQLGETRVQRLAVALVSGGETFHGFVSASDLAPLEGLTVRLTETNHGGAKAFTGKTEADGYFSIDLAANSSTPRGGAAKGRPNNISQRIADLFGGASGDATAAPTGGPEASVGQVEILKGDSVLYRDPLAVPIHEGSVFREYVIPDIAPSSPSGVRDVPTVPPRTPPRTPTQPKRAAKSAQPKKRK